MPQCCLSLLTEEPSTQSPNPSPGQRPLNSSLFSILSLQEIPVLLPGHQGSQQSDILIYIDLNSSDISQMKNIFHQNDFIYRLTPESWNHQACQLTHQHIGSSPSHGLFHTLSSGTCERTWAWPLRQNTDSCFLFRSWHTPACCWDREPRGQGVRYWIGSYRNYHVSDDWVRPPPSNILTEPPWTVLLQGLLPGIDDTGVLSRDMLTQSHPHPHPPGTQTGPEGQMGLWG